MFIVSTPSGLPTLSGFSAVIRASWNIVRRFFDEVPLQLRPKAISSYIEYNYLTVLLYYPIAPQASPVIV